MAKYELLSGEKIKLKKLKKSERKHIKSLEETIKECKNHDKEDYSYVSRQGLAKQFNAQTPIARQNNPLYKITKDLITRYWYKCFEGQEHFKEHLQKEGKEDEYLRYKRKNP